MSKITKKWKRKCFFQKHFLSLTGFTIIELLASIFIIAIIATILSVAFNISIRAYRQSEDILDITNRAQRFMGQITNELTGAVISQDPSITFVGGNTSIYFMAPWPNSSDIDLCELGYNLVGTEIRRHFVTGISAGRSFEYPGSVDYDDNVERYFIDLGTGGTLTFNYIDSGTSTPTWNGGNPTNAGLPQIVEITVTMLDKRNVAYTFITRIFLTGSI